MPAWQLETSSPELLPPPARAGANEELCPMSLNAPLQRRERDQGVHAGLKPAKEDKRTQRKTTTARKTTSGHGATWTSERVEQLKGCIRAGLTCSQIAAEIGVTRNAVIGKMNRLGLSGPKAATLTLPRARGSEWEGVEPKRAGSGSRGVRLFTQHRILMQLPPEPAALAGTTSVAGGRGCSLLDLSPGQCRWPISEPGAADFCFCGDNRVEGLPYCGGHARLAYKAAGRSRD
jgi:GcrA cell cycle regulator